MVEIFSTSYFSILISDNFGFKHFLLVIIPFLAVILIIGGSIFNYLLFLYHLIFGRTVSALMLFHTCKRPSLNKEHAGFKLFGVSYKFIPLHNIAVWKIILMLRDFGQKQRRNRKSTDLKCTWKMHKVVQLWLNLVNARPLNHLNRVNNDEVKTATGGKKAREERDQKVIGKIVY